MTSDLYWKCVFVECLKYECDKVTSGTAVSDFLLAHPVLSLPVFLRTITSQADPENM